MLITDTGPSENDYPLSPKVKRVYIPAFETSIKAQYRDRFEAWRRIIQEHDIDIIVYTRWHHESAYWDMLSIKSAPTHPAYISLNHSSSLEPYQREGQLPKMLLYKYYLCDGVVTLSEADKEFVSAFNPNVRYIVNPLVYSPERMPNSTFIKNTIVWCGRIASEKNPLDLLKALKYIRAAIPDVLLYIVGDQDRKLKERMIHYVEQYGLNENVRMVGFSLTPEKYYKKASVLLMTSVSECFPLVIGEAMSFGLPVVMYDIPWLTYIRDGRGIITVPQGQYTMMANEVVKLLKNPERIRELGAQGKQMVIELVNTDIMGQWDELFKTINSGQTAKPRDDCAAILYKYQTLFGSEGKRTAVDNAFARGRRELLNIPAVRGVLTGRIDVKNRGKGNEVILTDVMPGTYTEKPAWFSKNGQGAVLENTAGQMSFICQCVGNGTLHFDLRGRCIRDAEKKTLPYFVDFTSFTVNGEERLPKRTPVWHDDPYQFEMPVKDGEQVTVTAQWQPHVPEREVLIDAPRKLKEAEAFKRQIEAFQKSIAVQKQTEVVQVTDTLKRQVEAKFEDNATGKGIDVKYDVEKTLRESTEEWLSSVSSQNSAEVFEELVKTYGIEDVICCLAQKYWNLSAEFCAKFVGMRPFKHAPRPEGKKLTIGVYYRRLTNGGVENVCAMLCNRFVEQKDENGDDKYTVVMITDTGPMPDEYPLSSKVKRAYLPAYTDAVKESYRERLFAWREVIAKYKVDIVMHTLSWVVTSFWDLLAIKSAPSHPAFLVEYHAFCGAPFREVHNFASWLPYVYQNSDGGAVLSECDREYFSAYNTNVRYIPNPLSFTPQNTPNSDYKPNTIVWVGRISGQKNPIDVLKVLKYIKDDIPDVMLYIVGGENEILAEQMKQHIEEHDLSDNVVMTGFTLDTAKYYQMASVFLSTASFEGFPLTWGEALSYGVPIVAYDIPYLTYSRDGRGIISVAQRDCKAMAREVVKLLREPEQVRALGAQGKQMVTELANTDIMGQWEELFRTVSAGDGSVQEMRSDSAAINYRYITLYQQIGRDASVRIARTQEQREARNSSSVRGFLAGRIDVKNRGEGNEVILTEVTPGTYTEKPAWFAKNGQGAVLENTAGQMSFTVQCKGDGLLHFDLRGRCVRDAEKKTLPYFVDFTSFVVDGEEKLPKLTPVWHDTPFQFEMPVKDGQTVTVAAKWLPHVPERSVLIDAPKKLKEAAALKIQYDTVQKQLDQAAKNADMLKSQLESAQKEASAALQRQIQAEEDTEQLRNQLEAERKRLAAVSKKLACESKAKKQLDAALADASRQLANIHRGASFRIGRLVTWLPRKQLEKKW